MRTTITLDDDVKALLERVMQERGSSFKVTINEAIRAGLGRGRPQGRFRTSSFSMGRSVVSITKAHALAAGLEDEEIARELAVGR